MGRVASSSPSDGPVISAAAEVWLEPDTRAAGAHARMGSDSQTETPLGMQLWKAGLGTLLLSLLLTWPGQFHVMGPRSPVIAVVGAGAEFPCHLSPSTDVQHMEVRWFHGNHSGLVHYYRDSKDYLEQQRPEYHGRTELLRENITRGQVALRIHPIHPADEGDYRCLFVSSTYHNEARFHVEVRGGLMRNQPPPSEGIEPTELLKPGQVGPAHLLYQTGGSPDAPLPRLPQVRASATELSTQAQRAVTGKSVPQFSQARSAPQPVQQGMAMLMEGPDHVQEHSGSGSTPHIHVETDDAEGLKLTCTSTGWYPELEVHWEDSLEQHVTPASETKTTDRDGLFEVQTSIMVDKSLSANVSCFIRNPGPQLSEGSVCLLSSSCTWMVVLAVLISVLVLAAAICAMFLLARKDKGLNKIRKFAEAPFLKTGSGGASLPLSAAFLAGSSACSHAAANLPLLGPSEDIILDKDTAHPYLAVSPDGKCVKSVTKKHDVPDKPERFDTMPAVLGQNRFSSGSHYWEVEVAGNSKWTVGICVESVNRKGQYISAKTQSGFWTLCLKDGTYKALSISHHVLHVTGPLLRVGIFLQYKEGLISFYNVTECTILHTFKSKFTEPLRPYFYPEPAGEKSTNALTIVKVPAADPAVPL
ncbi:butyrophilin subfamily 1 member A1-like [Urocitellus parryii]